MRLLPNELQKTTIAPPAGLDPGQPRIEVSRLIKRFHRVGGSEITPVNDITLEVGAREMVVLLGPSGCGKTTLLRCIAGLERPDEGEIVIDGQVVFSSRRNIFVPPERRQLSMIFQSFALWPHMNVFDNVAYPLESRRVPRREIAPRVNEILRLVGIGDLGHQYPGRISGGQQQRVALARALVANSSVVLFDEPLSNVDARVREQLRLEMRRMQRQLQFSGLYVTHDQMEAMELGDRIAVLEAGRIAALGPPRAVYEGPASEYVATFIGAANVWPGRLAGRQGTEFRIETAAGELQAAELEGGPASVLRPGDSITVVVRPERLRLSARPPQGRPNAIRGTVESRLFAGSHTEVVLRCASLLARVWLSDDESADGIVEGAEAWIWVEPHRVQILPQQGAMQ